MILFTAKLCYDYCYETKEAVTDYKGSISNPRCTNHGIPPANWDRDHRNRLGNEGGLCHRSLVFAPKFGEIVSFFFFSWLAI